MEGETFYKLKVIKSVNSITIDTIIESFKTINFIKVLLKNLNFF